MHVVEEETPRQGFRGSLLPPTQRINGQQTTSSLFDHAEEIAQYYGRHDGSAEQRTAS